MWVEQFDVMVADKVSGGARDGRDVIPARGEWRRQGVQDGGAMQKNDRAKWSVMVMQ